MPVEAANALGKVKVLSGSQEQVWGGRVGGLGIFSSRFDPFCEFLRMEWKVIPKGV